MSGGNLIIESNRGIELDHTLPDPFPIEEINPAERNMNWDFKSISENVYISQIELDKFAPAELDGNPWPISEGIGVKSWARPLLTSEGKAVIVEGELGEGKVLWSGINLPFHINNSKNQSELEMYKSIILEYIKVDQQPEVKFKAEFINPQKRVLSLENEANAVLFKENFFPNWKAAATTPNGRSRLKIYQAGPGFMFAFLPDEAGKIELTYSRSALEWFSDAISVLTFLGIVYALLAPSFPGKNIIK